MYVCMYRQTDRQTDRQTQTQTQIIVGIVHTYVHTTVNPEYFVESRRHLIDWLAASRTVDLWACKIKGMKICMMETR